MERSPEHEVILCCARTQPDETTLERLARLVHSGLDWQTLLTLARQHKVLPLLFWTLQQHAADQVPEETLAQLRQEFYGNAWLNHHLSQAVVSIVSLLNAQDIPVLSFKGVTLAAGVYGNVSLRQAGDIDILVHAKDVLRAKTVLIEKGGFEMPAMAPSAEATYLQNALHFNFSRPGLRTGLELHWRLLHPSLPCRTDFEQLWCRQERVLLADTSVPTMGPTDLLRYLCLHGSGHMWLSLRWVCDVAELLHPSGQAIDWTRLISQAAAEGNSRLIGLGLYLAHHLFEAPLPPKIGAALEADKYIPGIASRVIDQFYRNKTNTVTPENHVDLLWSHFKLVEGWSNRFQLIRYNLAPHNVNSKRFALPDRLSFLYYFGRPARFAWKYARSRYAQRRGTRALTV